MSITLSHYQIKPLLTASRANKTTAITSTDLGITTVQASLDADGIRFASAEFLSWNDAEKIARDENACFTLRDRTIQKIQIFSELTNRPYSLYPTSGAPTMLVAGLPMHRIKDTDPWRAAVAMVKTLQPVKGDVLDTATGLGYTAIELAKTSHHVVTIELDPAAQGIARQNPWSQQLFHRPNIEQRIGDSFDILPTFAANSFDAILHDPPTMSLAGDLYSLEFYRELFRVLKRGGKLFHYIGDPESKFGANVTRGVLERLKAAGFMRVNRVPQAFGVVAEK